MSAVKLCQQLEDKIRAAYLEGVTLEDAEKLAAEFLYAQMAVSEELKKADLDSRMRKSGLKAVKAAVYLDECKKSDKKPSDTYLEQILNTTDLVGKEQDAFDLAEVERDSLSRYYDIFLNAHIYMRGIAKGRFE